tara:strand:+ start:4142 stop:4759 length:618 start_codon:yes stop_codon:yes gene_type:complete
MLVSILIPTLLERSSTFRPKLEGLYKQIKDNKLEKKVEIIVMCDNRTMKLSEKRNTMQNLARGKYFTHCDDDDNFTEDYCKKVVQHIEDLPNYYEEDPDVIGYDQKAFVKDQTWIIKPNINIGLELKFISEENGIPTFERFPWQWELWNRERFQHVMRSDADTNAREDVNWLKRVLLEYPKSMSVIENFIGHEYHYEDPSLSTCQ